jgi:hypothetical protein
MSSPYLELKSKPSKKPAEAGVRLSFFLGLLFDHDDGGHTFLQNMRVSQNYMAQKTVRTLHTLPSEPQIRHISRVHMD